ncbi:hypothetical protein BDV11DRAFT_193370 [Aspergillus similis]
MPPGMVVSNTIISEDLIHFLIYFFSGLRWRSDRFRETLYNRCYGRTGVRVRPAS